MPAVLLRELFFQTPQVTESTTTLVVNTSSKEVPATRLVKEPFPRLLAHFRGRFLTNPGKFPVSTCTRIAILDEFRTCFNVQLDHCQEKTCLAFHKHWEILQTETSH